MTPLLYYTCKTFVFYFTEPLLCCYSYLLSFLIVVALLRRNLQVSISLDGVYHVYPVETNNTT